jgi:phage terminase large subunit GpA-like protein
MDAIADPRVREIWVQKSAQVGWTEILGNAVAYFMDQDPSTMLLLQPTLDIGEAWSKDRLAPMIRDTPKLHGLVRDVRSRDSGNTLLHKQFPGGHITIAGANSAASLASRPIRVVLCDEVDRYPPSAGTEGDPIHLARERSKRFQNRRFLAGSTPTVKDVSRIEAGFRESDQRRFFVPCVHCGEHQYLKWSQVRWPDGMPDEAKYVCEHCGVLLDDGERAAMIEGGEWRATKPFNGIVGFHIWEAMSPMSRLSDMARGFIRAKEFPEQLKGWINTTLGETWEDREGEGLNADLLESRAGKYASWTAPNGAMLLTAGVDVQRDRVEVGLYAFGPGEETWTIAHTVIYGSPTDAKTWAQLDDLLARKVPRDDGAALPIAATLVDAGDGQTAGFVLDYCRTRRKRNILAGKGQSQAGKQAIGKPSKVDVNVRGQTIKRGAELWPVGSDTIKGTLAARFAAEGFIHFPNDLPREYYEQLTAERLRTKFTHGIPHRVWTKPSGARNEALDCFVYAYAAAIFAGLKRANWSRIRARTQPAPVTEPTDDVPVPAQRHKRRASSWMKW